MSIQPDLFGDYDRAQEQAQRWRTVEEHVVNAAFGDVVNKAPDDARAPDALLGLASVAAAQKDNKASRKYLVTIIEKYPESAAAATAKKALTVAN